MQRLRDMLATSPDSGVWLLPVLLAVILLLCLGLLRRRAHPSTARVRGYLWLGKNYIWIFIGFGTVLIIAAIILYVHQLPSLIQKTLAALQGAFAETPQDHEKLRNLAYSFAALAGALTIMATIPFQLIRVWLNERSTLIAEQSHITDQINKAVEGLGAEKTVMAAGGEGGVPNVAVRVGAIYALERIAQDSPRDHVQIIEILTAFLRENAPARLAAPRPPEAEQTDKSQAEPDPALRRARAAARYARLDPDFYDNHIWVWGRKLVIKTDIQSAMRVLGRRGADQRAFERTDKRYGERGYLSDLRQINLQGLNASRLNFDDALLTDSILDGAHLEYASLERADLRWAQLSGARMEHGKLSGANLSEAHIEVSDLTRSDLSGAVLHETFVKDADLSRINARGTDFSQAVLEGVDLSHIDIDGSTNLQAVSFRATALRGTDLSGLSPDLLEQCFGDASVSLPPGLEAGKGRLEHWHSSELEPRAFYLAWRAWQREIGYLV